MKSRSNGPKRPMNFMAKRNRRAAKYTLPLFSESEIASKKPGGQNKNPRSMERFSTKLS